MNVSNSLYKASKVNVWSAEPGSAATTPTPLNTTSHKQQQQQQQQQKHQSTASANNSRQQQHQSQLSGRPDKPTNSSSTLVIIDNKNTKVEHTINTNFDLNATSTHNLAGGGGQQHNRNNERMRIFVALFDYDPPTMSPNPDACDEELPFREGQLIKVRPEFSDKCQNSIKLECLQRICIDSNQT